MKFKTIHATISKKWEYMGVCVLMSEETTNVSENESVKLSVIDQIKQMWRQ